MSQLLSFATLIELSRKEDRIGGVLLSYGIERLNPDKTRDYLYEWQAFFIDARDGFLYADDEDKERASAKLVELCRLRGFDIPTIHVEQVIFNNQQTESLISQLQDITPGLSDALNTLSLGYSPLFEEWDEEWGAGVSAGSHWQSWTIAEVKGSSLYDVCYKLLIQLQDYKPDEKL